MNRRKRSAQSVGDELVPDNFQFPAGMRQRTERDLVQIIAAEAIPIDWKYPTNLYTCFFSPLDVATAVFVLAVFCSCSSGCVTSRRKPTVLVSVKPKSRNGRWPSRARAGSPPITVGQDTRISSASHLVCQCRRHGSGDISQLASCVVFAN